MRPGWSGGSSGGGRGLAGRARWDVAGHGMPPEEAAVSAAVGAPGAAGLATVGPGAGHGRWAAGPAATSAWTGTGRPPAAARTGFEQLALDSHILYQRPSLSILPEPADGEATRGAARRGGQGQALLEEILDSFGVKAQVTAISRGPVVTPV